MERYEKGMLAFSKAGHDKGKLYMVIEAAAPYVYLADGKIRTIDNPKKKKMIHIQIVRNLPEELKITESGNVKDEDIREIIRRFINV